MNAHRLPLLLMAVVTVVALSKPVDRAAAQEIGLTPLETTEVAKGYSADALKLRPVVNDKHERVARINDFIFGKDGNIYVVLAVDDLTGLNGHLIAVPLRQLKLDDSPDYAVLPEASRAALSKLPVYVGH
ncbi:PRC-barrel domain-containing protein [Bradyrhizobium genosp. P]|uniref:PRC-barrel domain-containing protein n=1 Tax=Bradyrhizobium genosp. P TaxID=83641 RepID=UPI003CF62E16